MPDLVCLPACFKAKGEKLMTTLYGIKNCDTVKKARKWLQDNAQDYVFHDFREDGLDEASLATWAESLGVKVLINRRSTACLIKLLPSRTAAID